MVRYGQPIQAVRGPSVEEPLVQVCAELDAPATLAREVRVQLHRAADWLLTADQQA